MKSLKYELYSTHHCVVLLRFSPSISHYHNIFNLFCLRPPFAPGLSFCQSFPFVIILCFCFVIHLLMTRFIYSFSNVTDLLIVRLSLTNQRIFYHFSSFRLYSLKRKPKKTADIIVAESFISLM